MRKEFGISDMMTAREKPEDRWGNLESEGGEDGCDDTVSNLRDDEEVRGLAKQRASSATQTYLDAVNRMKILSREEERDVAERYYKGRDTASKNILIEANLRWVPWIARRYMGRGMPLIDMIGEGNLGLIKAVEQFKPELGFRLATFAEWSIEQKIEYALVGQSRNVYLPKYLCDVINKERRIQIIARVQLGRRATIDEVADIFLKEKVLLAQKKRSTNNRKAPRCAAQSL